LEGGASAAAMATGGASAGTPLCSGAGDDELPPWLVSAEAILNGGDPEDIAPSRAQETPDAPRTPTCSEPLGVQQASDDEETYRDPVPASTPRIRRRRALGRAWDQWQRAPCRLRYAMAVLAFLALSLYS
jgi:hypothetical protein